MQKIARHFPNYVRKDVRCGGERGDALSVEGGGLLLGQRTGCVRQFPQSCEKPFVGTLFDGVFSVVFDDEDGQLFPSLFRLDGAGGVVRFLA